MRTHGRTGRSAESGCQQGGAKRTDGNRHNFSKDKREAQRIASRGQSLNMLQNAAKQGRKPFSAD
jgi:hypothetical protein